MPDSPHPTRIEGFTTPEETRLSCLVWPVESGWAWAIYDGDGSTPGSAKRGSGAPTFAEALEDAAKWAQETAGV